MEHQIILFDGVCKLCNASINFIIRNDPKKYFKFSSLQSETGKQLIKAKGINYLPDSLLLVEEQAIFDKSTAVLLIAKKLKGIWPVFHLLIYLPKPVRDFLYELVAKYRYQIFGKKPTCMLPSQKDEDRFL